MICSKCGKECKDTETFCGSCGNRLKEENSTAPKIDLSQAEGMANTMISTAKRNWERMGSTAMKLAAIAGLLFVSMFLWHSEIVTLTVELWGFKQSEGVSGGELLGDSGLLSFLITVMFLVSIAAIAYPFLMKHSFDKKMLLPAKATVGFTVGALLAGLIFGIFEGADQLGADGIGELLEYVKFAPSFQGWLLIAAFIGIGVLSVQVEKELTTYNRVG